MAFLHEEEDDHNHTDEKKEYGAEDSRLEGIMLQIFIIILFWISSKIVLLCSNILIILIILNFTVEFLHLFSTFAIKNFKNIL